MSRVRDILHQRELFSVEETVSVCQVARRMAELHVGAILVVRGRGTERSFQRTGPHDPCRNRRSAADTTPLPALCPRISPRSTNPPAWKTPWRA